MKWGTFVLVVLLKIASKRFTRVGRQRDGKAGQSEATWREYEVGHICPLLPSLAVARLSWRWWVASHKLLAPIGGIAIYNSKLRSPGLAPPHISHTSSWSSMLLNNMITRLINRTIIGEEPVAKLTQIRLNSSRQSSPVSSGFGSRKALRRLLQISQSTFFGGQEPKGRNTKRF